MCDQLFFPFYPPWNSRRYIENDINKIQRIYMTKTTRPRHRRGMLAFQARRNINRENRNRNKFFTNEFDFEHNTPSRNVQWIENDSNYKISLDCPGVKASDLSITIDDENILSIKGKRTIGNNNNDTECTGTTGEMKFVRKFHLDKDVDKSKIDANLSNGVLMVTIFKKEETKDALTTVVVTEGPHKESTENEEEPQKEEAMETEETSGKNIDSNVTESTSPKEGGSKENEPTAEKKQSDMEQKDDGAVVVGTVKEA